MRGGLDGNEREGRGGEGIGWGGEIGVFVICLVSS